MPRKAAGKPLWASIDRYFGDLLAPSDEPLKAALKANRKARLPAIDVSPLQGKFLQVLIQMTQAQRVLEIGTLGGYSTIWMARALPKRGRIISLEFSPRHAEVARANLHCAGPFDLVFIDADKENNPQYLQWALKLSRRGTVIVVDNIARQGSVLEAKSSKPDIVGTRRCLEMMAAEPRLCAVALQTVGVKGLDGFALAVVLH